MGFDYLRSFIAFSTEELIIPNFDFAIVDEADALLIDEARHPLVLAGNTLKSDLDFYQIAEIVGQLEVEKDFELDFNLIDAANSDFVREDVDRQVLDASFGKAHNSQNLVAAIEQQALSHRIELIRA